MAFSISGIAILNKTKSNLTHKYSKETTNYVHEIVMFIKWGRLFEN